MSRLHICNTFFEKELESPSSRSLANWMRGHAIPLQLQFLPLLYADPEDRILVSDLPPNPDPRLCLLDHPPQKSTLATLAILEHWGPSRAIASWAQTHGIPYRLPNWELIRTINSKVFSFTHSPKLPGAALLHSEAETTAWLHATPGPKVLKTPFGTAGGGHMIFRDPGPNVKRLYIWPLIGEPWVERVFDFSTQWKNGELLGVTPFENGPTGIYRGTFVREVEPWALAEHLAVARPLVQKIKEMGYNGHVGVDAFIYLWEGEKRVHPVVEVNARKTMSWIALQMGRQRFEYTRAREGLLPNELTIRGKTIPFLRNIHSI